MLQITANIKYICSHGGRFFILRNGGGLFIHYIIYIGTARPRLGHPQERQTARRAFLHPLPFLHHVNLQRANYQPRKRRRARLGHPERLGLFLHPRQRISGGHTISTAGTSFVSWASSGTAGVSSSSETETTAGASGASSGTANSTATATDQRRARLGLGLFAAVPSWGTGRGHNPRPARSRPSWTSTRPRDHR